MRDVSANIQIPKPQAQAHAEVLDETPDAKGGAAVIAQAQNTAYEQHRGPIILDIIAGGRAASGTGTLWEGRGRPQGKGRASEVADVWVWAIIPDPGGGGSVDIEVADLDTPSTVTWAAPADGTMDGSAWVNIGELDVADDVDVISLYLDVVDWSGSSPALTLLGVMLCYARGLTELAAGVYANGFTPHDLDFYAGEQGFSAPKLKQSHGNAQVLYGRFVGQICAADGLDAWPADTGLVFQATPPAGVTSATFRVIAKNPSGTSGGGRVLTVLSNSDSDPKLLTNTAYNELTYQVAVTPGETQRFFVIGHADVDIDACWGWWDDAELT